jgi:tRNA (adenine37-N6)-methyltransferase
MHAPARDDACATDADFMFASASPYRQRMLFAIFIIVMPGESTSMNSILLSPIGVFHSSLKHRYETPRQGVLAPDNTGWIELAPHRNFEQAVRDLEHFERLWIVFVFHLNPNWKPMVRVPRHRTDKVGVFATRAPFRPNPIGLSCVRLCRVEGLRVHIGETDILDGAPVLDIKPYLPYADSFPDAATGWVADACAGSFTIDVSPDAAARMLWIQEHGGINLRGYIDVQLRHDPTNSERKRITTLDDAEHRFMLAYRTWRILYRVDAAERTIRIEDIRGGYSPQDLAGQSDRHEDKQLHRDYLANFGPSLPDEK